MLKWILGIIFVSFIYLLIFSLCKAASKDDRYK